MATCTGLQSKPSNSFKCSFFQHLLSVNNAPSIMLNTESKNSHCPQRAYDLSKQMNRKEITTKGVIKSLTEKPWKHPVRRDL